MVALDVLRAIESARHNGVRRERRPSGCLQLPRATPEDIAAGAACRICFEQGGDLVSPCRCVGSQRFVHSACLRRWQRVASGGSHDDELRHATFCAVCTAPFSVLPPVPHLQPGCLLVAAPSVAGEFARAVVLICRADADEVEGLLLNRSSDEAEAARVVAEAEALLAEAQAFVTPSRRAPRRCKWPMRTAWRRGGLACAASDVGYVAAEIIDRSSSSSITALHSVRGPPPAALDGADGGGAAAEPLLSESAEERWLEALLEPPRDLYLARKSPTQMARVVAQLAAHVTQQRPVAPPDLLLFVGSVRWRRRQLLHDVSRGRWGLCRAVVADILSDAPLDEMWTELHASRRLSFAV